MNVEEISRYDGSSGRRKRGLVHNLFERNRYYWVILGRVDSGTMPLYLLTIAVGIHKSGKYGRCKLLLNKGCKSVQQHNSGKQVLAKNYSDINMEYYYKK
jgi:hypothetical protein